MHTKTMPNQRKITHLRSEIASGRVGYSDVQPSEAAKQMRRLLNALAAALNAYYMFVPHRRLVVPLGVV